MGNRIIIVAASQERGRYLRRALMPLELDSDLIVGDEQGDSWDDYRLMVIDHTLADCEPLLEKLPESAHVVLLRSQPLQVKEVLTYMQDPRVNHLLAGPQRLWHLRHVGLKLSTGQIFGFDRYLPSQWEVAYHRIKTHDDRSRELAQISDFTMKCGFAPKVREACVQVTGALLYNAMYEAPVDEEGNRIFARDPDRRDDSPQKVSLRYAVHGGRFYVSVRDRYGRLSRDQLMAGFESGEKKDTEHLGNSGFHLAASRSTWVMINALPGRVSEIICAVSDTEGLNVMSFAAHPKPPEPTEDDDEEGISGEIPDFWAAG